MQRPKASNISFSVRNSASNEADILIYDQIGEYFDWATWEPGGVTYNNFEKELTEALNQGKKVNIRINSSGGDVHSGIAIYNLIQRNQDKNIHVFIDSIAYSMAAVIVHAVKAENRHMAANAMMMIHSASGMIYGQFNGTQLRELADTMDKYDDILATSIASESNQSKEDILAKYFDGKDHYFTADEAKKAGFISDIVEKPSEASTPIENTIGNLLRNMQTQINNLANIIKPQNQKTMINLNDVIAKLRAGAITNEEAQELATSVEQFNQEKTTQEDVQTAVREAVQPLQSEKDALQNENDTLKSQIEDLNAKLQNATIQNSGAPVGTVNPEPTNIDPKKEYTFRAIPFQ
jgi:ATP-dependent protease ClpP protease subunit